MSEVGGIFFFIKILSKSLAQSLLVRQSGDVGPQTLEGVVDALLPPPLPHVGCVPHVHLVTGDYNRFCTVQMYTHLNCTELSRSVQYRCALT